MSTRRPGSESERRFRFLQAGGFAAAINWLMGRVFIPWMPLWLAVLLAYACGMVVAFVLFRHFVFEPSGQALHRDVAGFVLVNIVSALLVVATSVALVQYLFPAIDFNFYPTQVGHAIGIAVPVISSYFGHKRVTFRRA